MKETTFLIIGQGIAGTLLAHELDKREQDFIIIDDGKKNASLTCAGMVNPVVLKRFSPVWQGREQIQRARETMAELSDKLKIKLDYRFDMFRIFNNIDEQQTWINKATLPPLDGLLDIDFLPSPSDKLLAPLGVGKVHLSGRIDLHALLAHYGEYLRDSGRLYSDTIDYNQLELSDSTCTYGDIRARHVIFCEGYGLKKNPYFNHLPLNGNKGEVMTVRIPNLKLSATVKSSIFIMPLPEQGDDVYFIGATYNWTEKDTNPTEAGKAELMKKLQSILPDDTFASVEVIAQYAGMRPTVADRRPLLGQHETHKNLYVCNGLGTRGVMLGATMAKHLTALLLDDKALPVEVDIARFTTP